MSDENSIPGFGTGFLNTPFFFMQANRAYTDFFVSHVHFLVFAYPAKKLSSIGILVLGFHLTSGFYKKLVKNLQENYCPA